MHIIVIIKKVLQLSRSFAWQEGVRVNVRARLIGIRSNARAFWWGVAIGSCAL